jgi:hypothetical protein
MTRVGPVAVGWPNSTWLMIFQFLNPIQTSKLKSRTFPNSKNVQALLDARFEHDEQLSPLARLQIPNGSDVINFRIDSNLNLP